MRAYRFFLPSSSSIRQERSALLFREKRSAKLRSHEPPRESVIIFPPHVTLRFGFLKRHKMSHQDQFNVEKAATTTFCSVSYLPCDQESGLSWWRAVWSSFWFCPLVLSGADPFLGAAGRGPSSPSLWSVWLKKPVGGSSTRQCCCHLTRSDRPNRTRVRREKTGMMILASWSRRLRSTISFRYLLSRAPSSDTSVTWGSFFIFLAVLAN